MSKLKYSQKILSQLTWQHKIDGAVFITHPMLGVLIFIFTFS